MSSHARRSLRTTAAAAGIAAIGVGIAAPALAAPETTTADDAVSTEAPAPAGPAAGLLGKLPTIPNNISDLPMLFKFQGPTFNTAGPTLPIADPAATDDAATEPAGGSSMVPDPGQLTKQNNITGLPNADALNFVKTLAGKALSASPIG